MKRSVYRKSRRFFLKAMLFVLFHLYLTFGALPGLKNRSWAGDLLRFHLNGFWTHKNSAVFLGKLYVRNGKRGKNDRGIAEGLLADHGISITDLASMDREQFRSLMRNCIKKDFKLGHIVNLDGWILSRTEVRLCLLSTGTTL